MLRGVLIALGTALALYLLLTLVGYRLMRVERRPVPLAGSELDRSREGEAAAVEGVAAPVNLVVFVADGLGFAHLAAARSALHGMGGATVWDRFEATGWHRAHAANGFLIDSAASATALATGVPTEVYSVGVGIDGEPLVNLVERAVDAGYRTGIVTDSYVWDATPAAFATHVADRDDAESILVQLASSPLEILVGELEDLGEGDVPEREPTLEILQRRFRVFGPGADGVDAFRREAVDGSPAAAIFEEDQVQNLESTPTLPQLLGVALDRLTSDDRPFFLLVESEEADSASHDADFDRLLRGLEAIETTLQLVLDRAEAHGNTLVVFTSDHETGGLALYAGDRSNTSLRAFWATGGHTGTVVPVLATGPGAERFAGIHATWELGRLLTAVVTAPVEPAQAPVTSREPGHATAGDTN